MKHCPQLRVVTPVCVKHRTFTDNSIREFMLQNSTELMNIGEEFSA